MVTKTSDTKKTTKKKAADAVAEPAKTEAKPLRAPKSKTTAKAAAPKASKKAVEKEAVSSLDTKKRSTKKTATPVTEAAVKPVKTIKAKVAAAATETSEQEKRQQVVATRNKRDELKDIALKTHMKKFAALKEETAITPAACADKCCCFKSFGCSLKAWGRAYANIFNFKGRTSRYEFWAFMLINYLLLLVAGNVVFNSSLFVDSGIGGGVGLIIAFLLECVIYIALYTRRLHDTGVSGWKGFFRPLCIALVLWLAISVGGELWIEEKPSTAWETTTVSLAYIVFAISTLYYLLKVFLYSAFFEEQRGENAFGQALYIEDCYKKKSLCFAVWYAIIFGITFTLLSFRLALLTLLSQGLLY